MCLQTLTPTLTYLLTHLTVYKVKDVKIFHMLREVFHIYARKSNICNINFFQFNTVTMINLIKYFPTLSRCLCRPGVCSVQCTQEDCLPGPDRLLQFSGEQEPV